MARKVINSVVTFGNEERSNANFVELYAAIDSASASIASVNTVAHAASASATHAESAAAAASAAITSLTADLASVNTIAHAASASAAAASSAVAAVISAWSAFTPTVTAFTGTLTSYTATGSYKQIGKTVHWGVYITITNNGTGSNFIQVTLPVTANVNQFFGGSGRNDTTAKMIMHVHTSTTLTAVQGYDGSYPVATGDTFRLYGTYEAA